MATKSWGTRIAALALLGAVPMLAGATGLTSNWQGRVLAAQNRERAALGLDPLHWSKDLSASAQVWADHLARTGRFEHAPDKPVNPEGENIWGGTKGYYSADAMVDGWLVEKRHFHPGVFPDNSTTGQIKDVGHYTQIVWRDSRTVGCALARSAEEDLLVCRYAQAGNWIGEQPY